MKTVSKDFRDVYGEAIAKAVQKNEKVVVLDADLSSSSRTSKAKDLVPERFFNVGIAEANMVAMGAGFATSGFVPFVNTFATLASSMCLLSAKALIGYSKLNVRIVGSNNGLGGGYDGSTHHCLDDIGNMRAIPGMLVLIPSDPFMIDWAVDTLSNDYEGPAYLSIARNGADPIYDESTEFIIGKAKKPRQGTDVAIIADGLCVSRAIAAADRLADDGISCSVYDMFTVKPLDKDAVLEAAGHRAILTVEEHSVIGGLGTAVSECIAENGISIPFNKLGIQDCYTESGKYADLIHEFGVDAESIYQTVKMMWKA